jgi:hypothetical protein
MKTLSVWATEKKWRLPLAKAVQYDRPVNKEYSEQEADLLYAQVAGLPLGSRALLPMAPPAPAPSEPSPDPADVADPPPALPAPAAAPEAPPAVNAETETEPAPASAESVEPKRKRGNS